MRPGGLVQRPKFSPLSISGCVSWLRSDLGLPGQVDNTTAPTWNNQVVGGPNATQSTDAKRPVWHASGGLNNRPYLRFNGGQVYSWPLNLQGAKSVFCVLRLTVAVASGTAYNVWSIKGSTGPVFSDWLVVNVGGYTTISFLDDVGGVSSLVGRNFALGTTNGHCIVHVYNGGLNTSPTSYSEAIDGAAQSISNSGAVARVSTDLSSLGARLDAGNTTTANASFVEFYDHAVYNRALTGGEKTQFVNYARGLYATP